MNGKFFVVEGIDGTGKSTLVANLCKELGKEHSVVPTQESGGTWLGEQLREILHEKKKHVCDLAEYLLLASDRAQHFAEVVVPALDAGKIVVSDRCGDSSVVYQGYGRGLDIQKIMQTNEWAMQGITPDLTLYLHLDLKTAFERINQRNEAPTSFEQEQEAFWQRVIAGYEELFAKRSNVVRLDATQSPEQLTQEALAAILPKLT